MLKSEEIKALFVQFENVAAEIDLILNYIKFFYIKIFIIEIIVLLLLRRYFLVLFYLFGKNGKTQQH